MDFENGLNNPTFCAHELRIVRELLWEVVASCLPSPAEREEVKRAIGWGRVEDNEGLFSEASALAEILGDVQLSTQQVLDRQKLFANPQRRLVEGEVRMLMERLRDVASAAPFAGSSMNGRDPGTVVPRGTAKDKAVFEYVDRVAGSAGSDGARPRTASRPSTASQPSGTSGQPGGGRPDSAASGSACGIVSGVGGLSGGLGGRPDSAASGGAGSARGLNSSGLGSGGAFGGGLGGRPDSAASGGAGSARGLNGFGGFSGGMSDRDRPSTASSGCSSSAADPRSVVASVARQLNVECIDSVKDVLKEALADEHAALLEDVAYLTGLLEDGIDLAHTASVPAPSISDLKDYGAKLKAWESREGEPPGRPPAR
ncbi:hypothetical protein FOA52_006392 [Chlamydomonas sp. UWO 241]|nr:hypothetical protein FOA52_006392 [Chlamydomonas sp. UWO 241]